VPAASKKHSGELLEHLSNVQAVKERQRTDRQIDVLIRPEQMPEIAFKGSPPGTLTRTAASILDGRYVDQRSSEKEASGQARCTETADMSAAVAGAVGNASSAYSAGLGCAAPSCRFTYEAVWRSAGWPRWRRLRRVARRRRS
jgi:hypothetical protein